MILADLRKLRRLRDLRVQETSRRLAEARRAEDQAVRAAAGRAAALEAETRALAGCYGAFAGGTMDAAQRADLSDAIAAGRARVGHAEEALAQARAGAAERRREASAAHDASVAAAHALRRWDQLLARKKEEQAWADERVAEQAAELDYVIASQR